ncbi:MAG: hypothetical protein HY698_06100 [Deltaproteobacteria bacterium]|nr:hypothetical protein [Deltaproteobacteria bacterium]
MFTTKMKWAGFTGIMLGVMLALSGCQGADEENIGHATSEIAGKPGYCAIRCIAPPPGCEYKGAITSGPCPAVTCGHLVCKDECPIIDCAAPPPGCHYEGMVLFPCNQQTCGSLACDGSTL